MTDGQQARNESDKWWRKSTGYKIWSKHNPADGSKATAGFLNRHLVCFNSLLQCVATFREHRFKLRISTVNKLDVGLKLNSKNNTSKLIVFALKLPASVSGGSLGTYCVLSPCGSALRGGSHVNVGT